jgi:hypothetical protein
LSISSASGLAIQTGNALREKRIYATTSNDGSPWDEMVYHSKGSTGGWSGQHTFMVDKNGSSTYEALRIRDSGDGANSIVAVTHKLGVGTTSPQGNLHVVGDSGDAGRIYVSDADNGTGTGDSLLITKSGTNASIYNRDSGDLRLGSNNNADMVSIDSTGDVGIGTTSPSAKLDVVGTIECTGLSLQNGTLDYGSGKQQAADLAVGWYTFAVVKGRDAIGSSQRGFGEFLINDVDSGRHGSCRLNATHFFGSGNSIQVFAYNFYSVAVFDEVRIKTGGTYAGAALQVYVSNANNNLETYMTMSEQTQSWELLDTWLADSDNAGHDAILGYAASSQDWSTFTENERIDLSVFAVSQGGIYTTGGMNTEQLFLGKTGTAQTHRLHPDSAGSFIYANSNGSDITLAADDDLILHADDAITFQAGGVTKMTLLPSGNLGIGVTAPVSTLDIGASGALSLGNVRTQLKITNSSADLQLGHADNAHILIDTFNTSTDNYFSVRKNSTTASSATELFRVNENGKIKFNDAYDFPNAAGSTGDILTLQGNEVTFTTQDRITRPAVFMDTGTQNITLVETTVGFNSEILDGGNNAALSGVNDGHIQLTAGGYYRISYSIPINDDGSSGADRTRVFCFMQTSNDDSFTSPTTVAQSRSQVYTREFSGGSGLSTSFIYEHTGEDYIRLRIDAQNNTDISTESNQAQISIDYLGPA